MTNRLKPEQIQAGHTYKLKTRHHPAIAIRKVESIQGDKVLVEIKGIIKEFSLKRFADLAVEEIEEAEGEQIDLLDII